MSSPIVSVTSYLQVGSEFVPVTDFSGRVADERYVEGAIELRVGNVNLVTLEMWDLIDQLWAYILQGLDDVARGRPFMTYFPDQPIELRMAPSLGKDQVLVSVDCHGRRAAAAEWNSFFKAMLDAAEVFFRVMIKASPTRELTYLDYLRLTQGVRQLVGIRERES